MQAVEVVGQLVIPAGIMQHRFAREALACADILAEKFNTGEDWPGEQVVGTANTGKAELYGWAPNVTKHADKLGLVYLAALNEGRSMLEALHDDGGSSGALLTVGTVVRLDDFAEHWTTDTASRVCIFVGTFAEPCDEAAMAILQAGVDALARGDYYHAPRVRPGFRAQQDDECLVPTPDWDDCEPMLLADAQRENRYYEVCTHCDKPAVQLGHHWPHDLSGARCHAHSRA